MTVLSEMATALRAGQKATFAGHADSAAYAAELDAQDPVRHLRHEFVIPTRQMINRTSLGPLPAASEAQDAAPPEHALYFCGNSLGLQPTSAAEYVRAQLATWASIGVKGHFRALDPATTPLPAWQDMAAQCAKQMAPLVGAASADEVVAMNTLTVNLHLMMASFYRPTATRHKIIAEWKPFPSDSYALESQIQWHGLDVATSLIELQPDENLYISTESVLAVIDEHAAETALLLLPGIQYYTGQLFDMQRITAHARSKGIVVGWDLAHAVGNVELQLHDWDVDFAVWCTYKYLNAGPGSIAGAFVHERHGRVEAKTAAKTAAANGTAPETEEEPDVDVRHAGFAYRPRLSGWYGGDLRVRFSMAKTFQPTPGAQGFQLSNPSAIDLASLSGALAVYDKTDMHTLRNKSLALTAYAETLLDGILRDARSKGGAAAPPFRIITPADPAERGAQLSILLRDGDLLAAVAAAMNDADIIMDQRKPNVIRFAPVPLYNTFSDVHKVVSVLRRALLA
ncbi:putative secondary metabolism biosynthetic enzyme [Sporothrix epigloea]|uniref:Kynureninase n=1 Tax=Sporothrix epigloea TaxID=1892477 RepID=A0ABP0DY49_9PEZI